jgi:hypothetical protein
LNYLARGVKGAKPLKNNLSPSPLKDKNAEGELKRGEASKYNQGVLEGRSPSYITNSPSPYQGEGD